MQSRWESSITFLWWFFFTKSFQFIQFMQQGWDLHVLVLIFYFDSTRWSDFPPGGQISDHLHCYQPSGRISYHQMWWEIQPLGWKQSTVHYIVMAKLFRRSCIKIFLSGSRNCHFYFLFFLLQLLPEIKKQLSLVWKTEVSKPISTFFILVSEYPVWHWAVMDQYIHPANTHLPKKKLLKRHIGERPHKCNQCEYTSSQASNMKKHLKREAPQI